MSEPDKSAFKPLEYAAMRVDLLDGMELRDYFAAEALNSIYFNGAIGNDAREAADMARLAYLVADAMLKERAK